MSNLDLGALLIASESAVALLRMAEQCPESFKAGIQLMWADKPHEMSQLVQKLQLASNRTPRVVQDVLDLANNDPESLRCSIEIMWREKPEEMRYLVDRLHASAGDHVARQGVTGQTSAVFLHDCQVCIFLGSFVEMPNREYWDLYLHPDTWFVIARYGNRGGEYHCAPVDAGSITPAVYEAQTRAKSYRRVLDELQDADKLQGNPASRT